MALHLSSFALKGVVAAVFALGLAGCGLGRYIVSNPERNQTIRVESGDRFYFSLEENASTGYLWEYECDDKDVEVTIEHVPPELDEATGLVGVPGKAKVRFRVHRGYDGPSVVYLRYVRPTTRDCAKEIVYSLYRKTYDSAFWK